MTWCWLGRRDEAPDEASASAELVDADGGAVGWLIAWAPERDPGDPGAKVDARAVDVDGGPGWVSLVFAPKGQWLPFDDIAVAHATRRVLAMPPLDVCSTLLRGDARFVGSISAVHDPTPERLGSDPFAQLFPRVLLRAGPGLLGAMPHPVGPGTQRYGADTPWPGDRFS